MKTTLHVTQRCQQRGISKAMLEYVMEHGVTERDRIVLGRKEARQLLDSLQEQQRILMKILDKGGVVVVADGETLITTYNCQHRLH